MTELRELKEGRRKYRIKGRRKRPSYIEDNEILEILNKEKGMKKERNCFK